MTGPIVAHCGWTTVEFRPTATRWRVYCVGERIGEAYVEFGMVRVDTEHSAFARPTVERAAIRLAEVLHDDYVEWQAGYRPATARDLGGIGDVA